MTDSKISYVSPLMRILTLNPANVIASSFGDGGSGLNFAERDYGTYDDPAGSEFNDHDTYIF